MSYNIITIRSAWPAWTVTKTPPFYSHAVQLRVIEKATGRADNFKDITNLEGMSKEEVCDKIAQYIKDNYDNI